MLFINGSTIMLTRGDTATIIVGLTTEDGSAYTMQEGDALTFAAKKSVSCADTIITKASEDGVFEFAPEDTEGLEFGDYKYDIQLTTAGGDVYTVIPVSTFRIMEEIA